MEKRIEQVPQTTMDAFIAHHWPGNVRELQNLVERAVIRADNGVLPNPLSTQQANTMSSISSSGTLREHEVALILRTLRAAGGMIGGPQGAAVRLGLKRTTLISKMRRLGIYQPGRQAVIDQINEREESEPLVKREADDESSGSTDALALG
jgi:transcriptional regulator of acetoin/glycerol metabolism